jgi:hypothetical protein
MTSRETVHRAFSQVLDREPDEKGMEHYCAQLESGVLDSRGVEASLRASDEFARLQKKESLRSRRIARSGISCQELVLF